MAIDWERIKKKAKALDDKSYNYGGEDDIPIKTVKSGIDWNSVHARAKKLDDENYKRNFPTVNVNADEKDTAPLNVQKKEKKLDFFQKGAFEDGYQKGDITKAILGTVGDIGIGAVRGVMGLAEGVGDIINYGIAGIADIAGNSDFAEALRSETKESVSDLLLGEQSELVAKYSVLGRTLRAATEGIGQMATFGAASAVGSAAGLGKAGVSTLTTGMTGLSGIGSGMSEAYQGGAEDKDALTYGIISGTADALTEALFGGLGKGINAVGFNKGLSSADDMLAKKVSNLFTSQIAKNITEFGVKSGAEGVEELLAGAVQAMGKKITYMPEKELSEILKDENLLEQFVVGTVTGGFMQSVDLKNANKTKTDFVTGFSQNEQKVIDAVVKERIAEKQADGKKLTAKEKSAVENQVIKDLEKGYISTDTIESVLGGDTYKEYKKGLDKEDSLKNEEKTLREEFNTLNRMENGKMTGEQIDRREELRIRLEELKTQISQEQNSKSKPELKSKLSEEVSKLAKADRLSESYNEKERKSKAFEADLSKYSANEQKTVQRAVESGILNNTNRTHDFVDMVAKLSAEKGVLFDFTNNEKLKESGLALENVSVDGYIQGKNIAVNIDSVKALNTVVGHEITHVLEGSELYTAFADGIKQYAMSKGVYDAKLQSIAKLYEGVEDTDIDAEVTADLVGDLLFTDSEFINRLSAEQPNVFKRVFNEIKYLCRIAAAGSKEARQLEKVKKTFEDAYRQKNNTATENDGARYSMAGIKSKTHSLSLLEKAIRLDDVGKATSEEIRQQTGWFKGYDGKWRYEISNREMEVDTRGKFHSNPDIRRYTELVDKVYFDETATDAEIQELETLDKKLKDVSVEPKTLGDLIKHDALFKAYPQLKDIKIYFKNISEKSIRGAYNPVFKEIVLDSQLKLNKSKLEKTLIHEIQHAIQDIEGFSGGSGDAYWRAKGISEDELHSYYQNTAGEVEARDAAERYWRSEDALKEKRPDIDRTDVVFADDSVVGYSFNDTKTGMANDKLLPYNEELTSIIEKKGDYIIDSFDKLKNIVRIAFHNPKQKATAYFGILSPDILSNIEKSITNLPKELNGTLFKSNKTYSVAATLDSIKHLADGKNLSEQDVLDYLDRMADTIIHFDTVAFDYYYQGEQKSKGVIFKKTFADGTMQSFEIVSNKKRSLNLQTIYMEKGDYKKKKSAETLLMEKPSADAQSAGRSNFNNIISNSAENVKQKQLEIINAENPAPNTYNTWVRSVDDIKTFEEALSDPEYADYDEFNPDFTRVMAEDALKSGKITVYSSYPIKNGVFITPSRMEAESYSGSGRIYEKIVALNDVAWIDVTQGQYAKVDKKYSLGGENIAPVGDYRVYGKDVALAPTAEDIARMKENNIPDDYAPTAEDIAPVRNDMQTPSNDIAPIRSDIKQNDDIGPVRELSVKEQLKANNKVLNEMEVVSSVNEDKTFTSKQDVAEWALKKFEKIGFKVSRKGFGEIIIDKRRVKKGLSYLKTNEERLALAAVPQVLSDGVQIGGHTLHKGRAYNTLTFAAPVEINGQRGNLAVVVRQEGKNYYKVHRLIMPDGKQFVLYKNKEDIAETVGGVENGSGLSPTDNVFNNIIPQTTVNGQGNSLKDDIGPVRDDIQDVKNMDFTLLDDIPAEQENVPEIDGADISEKSKERIKNELIKANKKIDADFSYERNSLIDEFNKRRELLEGKVADKNVYFTENAAKLYNELIKLKKGVKASDDLGYLLDSLDSKNWGTLKAALVNTRNFPGRVVNSDSAIEGVVREMLEEQYNSDVAELENIDASLNDELEKLKEKADERRKSAKLAVNGKLAREIIDSEVVKLMGDTSFWKDKRLGISYKTNTERRNFRDIVKDKNGKPQYKVADALYDYFMGTYNHNEASLNREANKIRQEYAELKLNKYEDAFVQIKGEFLHNPHSELTQHDVDTFLKLHGKHIDESKVDKTIDMARKTYDSLIERMNDVLVAHGMKPIEYRSGYFPHFSEPKQGVFAKLLNWKIQDNEIPTDIAGLTESFKPNRSWQSFNKQRISDETDYSFTKGFDRYLQGSLDWIYHIDDIMKRRVFENRIRYDHSDKGIKAQIDEIYKSNEYDSNEKQNQIDMVFREAGNPLNNFIQDFRARTNTLAGKKSSMDRGMEEITSRKFYSTMSNLSNKISGNMVAGSVSSALTNFIPITQSWLQVSPKSSLIAMAEVMKNAYSNDGTVYKSDFLTNRLRKSENLHQTGWDKASKAVTWLMEGIDSFTSQTVWRSKYNENISKGMSEAEAIKNADQFAENVLAGRSRGNMPTIFDSKNPLLKIATAFQLEVNNQYGYMFKDAPQDMKNESKAKLLKGYATMFIGAYAYNMLYSALTGRDAAFDPIGIVEELLKDLGVFSDDEDEEKEINIPETAMNLFDNVLEEMPFVSGLVGGGRIPLSSALPYGDNIRDAIEGNITDISEGDWENLTKEWLGSAGAYVLAPIGGGQLRKTVQGLMMYDDDLPIAGSYTDSGKLRFTAENDLPHKIQSALFGQYSSSTARQYFDEGRSSLSEKQMEELIQLDIPIEKYWEYKDGLKALGKDVTFEEKADYIANLEGYSTEQKNIMVNNLTSRKTPIDLTDYDKYGDIEELDYAIKHPEKYTVAKSVGGYNNYKTYLKELRNIKSVKDENGKTVSGSRKEKVLNYINNLDAEYGEKLILFKSEYPSDDTYNYEIIEYLNDRDDISREEMETILKELGFDVYPDGTVKW